MDFLSSFSGSVAPFFSLSNPSAFAVQLCMITAGFIVAYLVLFATRDILLRTHSFGIQVLCILLVALLPVIGFLLYLLVRPSQTNAQKKMQADLHLLLEKVSAMHGHKKEQQNTQKKK